MREIFSLRIRHKCFRTKALLAEAADLMRESGGKGSASPDTSGTDSPSDFLKQLNEKIHNT